MPKDKNGIELKIGDRVTLECVVAGYVDHENDCNLVLETVELFNRLHCSTISLNSKQVVAYTTKEAG